MTKPISHRFQLALSCAGGLLLVLASASYAADTPAGAMANPTPEAASNPPQVAAEPPANQGWLLLLPNRRPRLRKQHGSSRGERSRESLSYQGEPLLLAAILTSL